MKIIDWEKKGNVIRFYLGEDDLTEWWGDDWGDAPYDCNAGEVYNRFVSGYADVAFGFDWIVKEPCEGKSLNCRYCKDDFVHRVTPIIIASYKTEDDWRMFDDYDSLLGTELSTRIYIGDHWDEDEGIFGAKTLAFGKLKDGKPVNE